MGKEKEKGESKSLVRQNPWGAEDTPKGVPCKMVYRRVMQN